MNQLCISNLPDIVITIVSVLGAIAGSSAVANFVKPDTKIGKIINWIALNFKGVKKTGA